VEPLKGEISGLLLPHQESRLNELLHRAALERLGMKEFVNEFAKARRIPLSAEERNRIADETLDAERALCIEVNEANQQFFERLSDKFPAQAAFLEKVATRTTPVALDVLFVCAGHIDELEFGETENELRERLGTMHYLELDRIGNWQLHGGREAISFDALAQIVKSWKGDSGGLLDDAQMAAVETLSDEHQRRFDEIGEELQQIMLVPARERTAEAATRLRDAYRDLDDEFFDKVYRDVLFDQQRQWLIDFLRERETRSLGVLGMLLLETDAEGKPVTDRVRREMRGVLKSEIEELQKEIAKLYQKSIDEQVDRLPDSVRHEVREVLGKKPDFMLPNLSMLYERSPLNP
jgi:hypothetical protein